MAELVPTLSGGWIGLIYQSQIIKNQKPSFSEKPGFSLASDAETIKLAKRLNPSAVLCNLTRQENPVEYVEFSQKLDCRIIQPSHTITTRELVEAAHARNMLVNVFYADEVEDMKKLIELGV